MHFSELGIAGAFEITIEPHSDERGFFGRSWCQREFEEKGLSSRLSQCNVSFNRRQGTLRGMHYQDAPFPECKLVRCTKGAIYDVVVDLRADSATFRRHCAAILAPQKLNMMYVPEGCAHGFLTLEDDTEVFYQMSEFYVPELSRGFRWDDPSFAINWPSPIKVISDRDRGYPDFDEQQIPEAIAHAGGTGASTARAGRE
jgi:dTDP-4-dehydrorhamnose 3,5-epimerase